MAECAEASDSEARKNNEKQKNEKRYSETEGETHTGQSVRIFRFSEFLKQNRPQLGHFLWPFRSFWFQAQVLGFSDFQEKV